MMIGLTWKTKHQDVDANMTIIENNPNKKKKEKWIKMLIKVITTHKFLAKNFFEINLKKWQCCFFKYM